MRRSGPFSDYNRAKAMYVADDFTREMPGFSALDALCANEIQLIYLFVKWSECNV